MRVTKREKVYRMLTDARIQRAVAGFHIPMIAIPELYAALTKAIAEGQTDDDLKAIVAENPDVRPGI